MFSVERRERVRGLLVDRARDDERITGIAITGSFARGAADRWSDVDLFFGVRDAEPLAEVCADYGEFVHRELGAVHHFDLDAPPAVYRAFLLSDLLEVDLGFTPASAFGPRGDGAFRVVAGQAGDRQRIRFDVDHVVGLTWHHLLHARVSIERGNLWQAEYWISALRDITLRLAAHRLGRDTSYNKGADGLPGDVTAPLADTLVRALDTAELRRALDAVTDRVLAEARLTGVGVVPALEEALRRTTR